MRQKRGYTPIELLVVIGILMIIFAISLTSLSSMEKEDRLQSWADQVEATLNYAKTQALNGASLSGSDSLAFGVHFSEDDFTLFPGLSYQPTDSRNLLNQLPESLYFATINLPSANDVIFQKITGEVINFDPLHSQLILRDRSSQRQRTISINKLGVVEITH